MEMPRLQPCALLEHIVLREVAENVNMLEASVTNRVKREIQRYSWLVTDILKLDGMADGVKFNVMVTPWHAAKDKEA